MCGTDAISRSAAIADLKEWLYRKPRGEFEEGFNNALNGAIERIGNSNVNPALDVAPVVRCRECKHRCTLACPMYHTETCLDDLDGFDDYNVDRTDNDGFCHLGARMDGEENG